MLLCESCELFVVGFSELKSHIKKYPPQEVINLLERIHKLNRISKDRAKCRALALNTSQRRFPQVNWDCLNLAEVDGLADALQDEKFQDLQRELHPAELLALLFDCVFITYNLFRFQPFDFCYQMLLMVFKMLKIKSNRILMVLLKNLPLIKKLFLLFGLMLGTIYLIKRN